MNDLEKRVWAIIRMRRGSVQAISRADLAAILGISDRRVRGVVRRLVETHQCAICADYCQTGGGYFVPASPEEAKKYAGQLISHALRILERARIISGAPLLELAGQERLFELGLLPGERGRAG